MTPYASGAGWELWHGDCLEVMRSMPEASVDAIVTDPPYGVGKAAWDGYFPRDWFHEARRVAKPEAPFILITGAGRDLQQAIQLLGPLYRATMAAWLCNGMTRGQISFGNWTAVSVGCTERRWKAQQDVIRVTVRLSERTAHPCQKPLELMQQVVERLTEPGWRVLDPFAGSGTTALACAQAGRSCVAIEREDEYCRIIEARLSAALPEAIAA